MASYRAINNPLVFGAFTRPADAVVESSATTTWEAAGTGINAYGRQASFDFLSDGAAVRGLRISILRSANAAEASNGYVITVTQANARSVTVDDSAKTVAIVLTGATTLGQLKTAIDADTSLTSVYFGGGAAGNATSTQDIADSAGGIEDQWAAALIMGQSDLYIQTGTAAPTAITSAIVVRISGRHILIPPGETLYRRSRTGTARTSVEVWRGPVNG